MLGERDWWECSVQESGDFVIIRLNQQLKINSPLPRSRFCHNQQLQIIIRANIKCKKNSTICSLFLLFPFLLCVTILKQWATFLQTDQELSSHQWSLAFIKKERLAHCSLRSCGVTQQTEMVEERRHNRWPIPIIHSQYSRSKTRVTRRLVRDSEYSAELRASYKTLLALPSFQTIL